jgi:hypothetical protein
LAIAWSRRCRDRFSRKRKANAIYVDVDKSCRVKNSPNDITREDAAIEYERASRYGSIVARLPESDAYEGLELRKLKDAKVVFWQKYKPISEIGYSGRSITLSS